MGDLAAVIEEMREFVRDRQSVPRLEVWGWADRLEAERDAAQQRARELEAQRLTAAEAKALVAWLDADRDITDEECELAQGAAREKLTARAALSQGGQDG